MEDNGWPRASGSSSLEAVFLNSLADSIDPKPTHDVEAAANFLPKQIEATRTAETHRYTFFGGPRGPGKSYWLRWFAAIYLARLGAAGIVGARFLLGSEDYPTLYDRQLVKIRSEFPPWLGEYHPGAREFVLAPEYGTGTIAFRNLDEPDKYAGSEWAGIGIEELPRQKPSTFHKLRGSLRWPGVERPVFVAVGYPVGIGKKFVRELWVEHHIPEELEPLADEFAFVRALPKDNPYLPASYWVELETKPEALRRAELEGDWYVSFEGLVYANFANENVCEFDVEPDPDVEVELAFDDGYIDPRCFLFIQRTSTRIFVFDEIYHRKHLPEACVREVLETTGSYFGFETGKKGKDGSSILTADVDEAAKDELGRPIPANLPAIAIGSPEAKVLREHLRGANIATANPKEVKIVPGIEVVQSLILDGQGRRTLVVHPRCTNFIEELTEGYIYPEDEDRKKPEVPVDKNNHASDALRQWATSRAYR